METRAEQLKELWSKIKEVKVAMLTTVETDGTLRSRPMATLEQEFNGTLWFFSREHSHKVAEIAQEHEVNLAYAEPHKNVYVSVSGSASFIHDRETMEKFWSPVLKAWFPDGLDDPDIVLIAVNAHYAEFWDAHGSRMVHLFGMLKSIAKGERYQPGENKKIAL